MMTGSIIDVQPKVICFCWEKQASVALTMSTDHLFCSSPPLSPGRPDTPSFMSPRDWAPHPKPLFSLNRWTPQPGWGHCCFPPKMVNTSAPPCMCITHVFSQIRVSIPYMEVVNTCVAAKLELSPPPWSKWREAPHSSCRVPGFEHWLLVFMMEQASRKKLWFWSLFPKAQCESLHGHVSLRITVL